MQSDPAASVVRVLVVVAPVLATLGGDLRVQMVPVFAFARVEEHLPQQVGSYTIENHGRAQLNAKSAAFWHIEKEVAV